MRSSTALHCAPEKEGCRISQVYPYVKKFGARVAAMQIQLADMRGVAKKNYVKSLAMERFETFKKIGTSLLVELSFT